MRGQTSIVCCDGDDGFCGTWDVDHYATGAYSVDGIRVSREEPAPGWTTSPEGYDYCPEHSAVSDDDKTGA